MSAIPSPKAAPDLNPWPLTIASYNIHSGIGTDGRFDPARTARVIEETGADVVALQEVPMGGPGRESVLDVLQKETRFHSAEGANCSINGCRYGNAILSRYPISAVRTIDLSFGSFEPRGAIETDLDCHGHPLRVVATHLGLNVAERRDQISRLLERFDTDRMAVVLLGDINEWFVWGRTLRQLKAHFQKAPSPPTFPSRWPLLALDRIWIRPRQRLVHVRAHRSDLARVASDHLPLVAHIGAERSLPAAP